MGVNQLNGDGLIAEWIARGYLTRHTLDDRAADLERIARQADGAGLTAAEWRAYLESKLDQAGL